MRKILVLATSLLLVSNSWAQSGSKTVAPKPQHNKNKGHHITKEERTHRKADLLKSQLGLSDDQSKKVESSMMKRNDALSAVRVKVGENNDAFRTEALPIRKQFQADLKSILTPEQFSKFTEIRKSNKRANPSGKQNEGDDLKDETELDLRKN